MVNIPEGRAQALRFCMIAEDFARECFAARDKSFGNWVCAAPVNSPRPERRFQSEARRRVLAAPEESAAQGFSPRLCPLFWQTVVSIRGAILRAYCYAIPTSEAIDWMVKLGPIVEIGAGKGFWASCIAEAGGEIVAFEPDSYSDTYFPTQTGMAGQLEAAHASSTLFLCWPPDDTEMAADSLEAFVSAGGKQLVYVGESEGLSTGTAAFFECIERNFDEAAAPGIPRWPFAMDRLHFYQRRR